MRFQATLSPGSRVYRDISIIRCESSLTFRLAGETDNRLPDLLAFLVIIHLALKSGTHQSKLPSLFRTMAQDATLYFLVIFSSHLLLMMTLIFGSVRHRHLALFTLFAC